MFRQIHITFKYFVVKQLTEDLTSNNIDGIIN